MQYLLKMMQSAQLIQNSPIKSLLSGCARNSAEKEELPENILEATTNIPPNVVSRPIRIENVTDDPFGSLDKQISVRAVEGILQAEMTSNNSDVSSVSCDWFKNIPLSRDCHECNVQLELISDRSVQLRVVKFIAKGESLKLWFSQQILIALKVPFLSPMNIQDEKLYVCNLCDYKCDMPNPLKIHLALNCGEEKLSSLWDRLRTFYRPSRDSSEILNGNRASPFYTFNDKDEKFGSPSLSPIRTGETLLGPNDSPIRTPDKVFEIEERGHDLSVNRRTLTKRSSAFKPYSNYSIVTPWFSASRPDERPEMKLCSNELLVSQDLDLATSRAVLPCNSFLNSGLTYQTATKHSVVYKDPLEKSGLQLFHQQASEIETFISNLGKSKQGHLCIYCGKTYSRKYGLKIHIRTHTGFKPLKCKYCLRPFGDPSNLNKHIRLHAGGKTPYKCDLCGKVLVRRRDLEKHIKSRHYTC